MNTKKNVPDSKIRHIIWWERVDSNHRSRNNRFTVCPLWPLGYTPIFIFRQRGAGGRIRTPDLLITNQLLYQLSYTSISTLE